MKIKIEIMRCRQCTHIKHNGSYTGGAPLTWICGHPDVTKIIGKTHRKHRVIETPDENFIPVFCPMLNGRKY